MLRLESIFSLLFDSFKNKHLKSFKFEKDEIYT